MVYHKFQNAESALFHMENMNELFGQMMAFMDFKGMTVFGNVDDALKEAWTRMQLEPIMLSHVGGK